MHGTRPHGLGTYTRRRVRAACDSTSVHILHQQHSRDDESVPWKGWRGNGGVGVCRVMQSVDFSVTGCVSDTRSPYQPAVSRAPPFMCYRLQCHSLGDDLPRVGNAPLGRAAIGRGCMCTRSCKHSHTLTTQQVRASPARRTSVSIDRRFAL